jgi:OmpA-OmpF porin, OOP family
MWRVLVLLLIYNSFRAQSEYKKWGLGLTGGVTQYNGDRGQGFYSTGQPLYGFGGLSATRFISKHFDLSFLFTRGEAGHTEPVSSESIPGDKNHFRTVMNTGSIFFRYNILAPKFKLRPYLFLGAGIIRHDAMYTVPKKRTVLSLPGTGFGLSFRLGELTSLQLQETFMYTNADDLDFEVDQFNDAFLLHSIGLVFHIGRTRDDDQDGVSDARDKCPDTPYDITVDGKGCPVDKDEDGLADHLDPCPNDAGPVELKGCPDKDNDKVADRNDKCPDLKGSEVTNGCPDTDRDGIADTEDKCPGTKDGYRVKKDGCPMDNDGDGVVNEEDQCPNLEGLSEQHGCPDTDGDGIPDINDRCPTRKGTAETKGCPEVALEDAIHLKELAKAKLFEEKSIILKKNAYSKLNQLAEILKKYSSLSLMIESVSPEIDNAILMKQNEVIRDYLIKQGVSGSRLSSTINESEDLKTSGTAVGFRAFY